MKAFRSETALSSSELTRQFDFDFEDDDKEDEEDTVTFLRMSERIQRIAGTAARNEDRAGAKDVVDARAAEGDGKGR